MCSAQLSWRQAPAAVRRSEQQAKEHRTKQQDTVESADAVQEHKGKQRPAATAQVSRVQATEAEVSAVLHDPTYRHAGLTVGAARQIAQLKRDNAEA